MRVYYNEIDPFAAAWLRELMKAGQIPDGEVDERSIVDVQPDDLRGFRQCHFFAGIGGWAYALRLAGWSDDREVWTGSCPCQPFSTAGKGTGFTDERHLWPAWHHLIRINRPSVIFGEQVEAAINHGWLDLVQDDMEGEDYAFAPVGLPAASVGTPHIRQRLWFVADDNRTRLGKGRTSQTSNGRHATWQQSPGLCAVSELGHHHHQGPQGRQCKELSEREGQCAVGPTGTSCGMGNNNREREHPPILRPQFRRLAENRFETVGTELLGGFWSHAEWLGCADNKLRPVEPGTFPLAHGAPARVGRLRGYGNAIVPQVAQVFIEAFLEAEAESR